MLEVTGLGLTSTFKVAVLEQLVLFSSVTEIVRFPAAVHFTVAELVEPPDWIVPPFIDQK